MATPECGLAVHCASVPYAGGQPVGLAVVHVQPWQCHTSTVLGNLGQALQRFRFFIGGAQPCPAAGFDASVYSIKRGPNPRQLLLEDVIQGEISHD
jgi:hypothetical protein